MAHSNDFDDRRKFIILAINKKCREEWSDNEAKKGKMISIDWAYGIAALSVIPMYEEKGWIMSHEVMLDKSGRTLFIRIKRPDRD